MATTEAAPLAVRGAELEVALGEVDAVLAAVPGRGVPRAARAAAGRAHRAAH